MSLINPFSGIKARDCSELTTYLIRCYYGLPGVKKRVSDLKQYAGYDDVEEWRRYPSANRRPKAPPGYEQGE